VVRKILLHGPVPRVLTLDQLFFIGSEVILDIELLYLCIKQGRHEVVVARQEWVQKDGDQCRGLPGLGDGYLSAKNPARPKLQTDR
jgi:hypothetical protein